MILKKRMDSPFPASYQRKWGYIDKIGVAVSSVKEGRMIKKLYKIFTSRMFWMLLIFGLQFVGLATIVLWSAVTKAYYLFFMGLSLVMGVIIITRKENNAYRLMWMFVIIIFPFLGGVLYLLFANKKIGALSEKKIADFKRRQPDETDFSLENADKELCETSPVFRRQSQYVKNVTGFSAWKNTEVKYFDRGADFFPDLLENVKKAEKFIFVEYFIIDQGKWWNRILEVLKEKVREGVDVRVVFDDMGSINVLPRGYDKILQSYGIKAMAFNKIKFHVNPRLNFRDHRKIFDIDGNICYTGGVNLADEYSNDIVKFGYWKDDAIRLTGSACWNFTLMFLRNWDCLTKEWDPLDRFLPTIKGKDDGFVQAFDDSPLDDNTIAEDTYLQIINHAKKYVWITTPYLILDEPMEATLKIAAKSGVDVRIITPHYPDKKSVFEVTRSNYESLLKAGVKIYEFTPGFIHSKNFISDDEIAVVGTTNLDYRSFYLHFELSVLFFRSSIVEDLKNNFENTLQLCQEIHVGDEGRLPLLRRIFRGAARIMSPLF